MRALVLNGPNQPFELADLPRPRAGVGEAVARVRTCGSGLTIQHVKAGRTPALFPIVLGHEITADIVEVGRDVGYLHEGDAVTAYYYLYCGACRWCQADLEPLCERLAGNVGIACNGGYAEYVKLPARNFIPFPDGLDHVGHAAECGVVTDAIATPYKVVRRAGILRGETVAVIGAGGGLGLHQILLAKWAGARVIAVDRSPDKLASCRRSGADETVDASTGDFAEALRDLSDGRGVDVVADYVASAETLDRGARALGRRGRLVILGGGARPFSLQGRDVLLNEQAILGSRYVSRREVVEALELVARGEVWPIVSEIHPLSEAEALHARIERGDVVGRAALRIH